MPQMKCFSSWRATKKYIFWRKKKATCILKYLKAGARHDGADWEDDGLSLENVFFDRSPRLQNATDASLFFLTNAAGAAFRLRVQWVVDQLLTHLSFTVQELSAPYCCSWEPWTEINGSWKSFIITIMPERAVLSVITSTIRNTGLTRHLLMSTHPGLRRVRVPEPVQSYLTQWFNLTWLCELHG